MATTTLTLGNVNVPRFLYGTAWKEDKTQALTELALQQGFRGIDTANQRRHYHEAAVGDAIASAIDQGWLSRQDLFLQTKFTFRPGQDDRLPYDPAAPIPTQVQQSFASSLSHLKTDIIDSYILHGPSRRIGLGPSDWQAWRAMEEINAAGRTRLLGISNVSLEQLESLCEQAQVRPTFVQNRCYASTGWDREVRRYCAANEITYQGFSLLTANRELMTHPALAQIAKRHKRTISQIVFRFTLDVGMLPLTGTSSAEHMKDDLAVFNFQLERDEVNAIEVLLLRK